MKTTPLGDRHNGKNTCLIREDDGREYIYKPRSAQTERAWSRFLSRLSDAGLVLLPKCVEILSENGSEHTEAIVRHRETDEAGLYRYWQRCGTLVFLTYLLGSTDLHNENLIAHGEYPVLVDLETLMNGTVQNTVSDGTLLESVFQSHLLPHFVGGADNGGLTGTGGKNLPLCEGKPVSACQYLDELRSGFETAYRFALSHRALLKEALSEFSGCTFRTLLRPTTVYFKMLHNLQLIPEEERPALADSYLRRAYTHGGDAPLSDGEAKQLQAETDALLAQDIPLFYADADGTALFCAGKKVREDFFRLSAMDAAKQRLLGLNETDLEKQKKLITAAINALMPLPQRSETPWVDWTEKIGTALEANALPAHKSDYVHLINQGNYTMFCSVGFGAYYGLCGLLCCYAAFYAKTGEMRWRSCLVQGLTQLETDCIVPAYIVPLSDEACSLHDGLGGMIAALLHVAELTGERRAYDDAVALAEKLDAADIGKCTSDLLGGAAGICLPLPKLPKNIAGPIAEALLPILIKSESTLTGAAHGAAGHALALGALQTALGTDAADEKILALLHWEDEQYVYEKRNWKDLRDKDNVGYMRGWCNGAPGIGMCRKQLLSYTKNEEILNICREDIRRAQELLMPPLPYNTATLCCGEAARLMAASCLGIKVPHTLSRIVRADAPELFHPMNTADAAIGLMQGLAGIGYALAMEGDERSGGMLL